MSNIAVSVENLSKQYQIGQLHKRNDTLRDALAASLGCLRRRSQPDSRVSEETFWALKNVNFDVKRGEVVGIIGHNGAGKSTLLKILSRITEPTSGRAKVHGRVGSLLEMGTGFHPELTGRENIYLNGAMLGMRRGEIEKKFDEIVAFAEIEKFLDTPVKRFSSGMYVRLAFAVAAHLEPEILLIDEVLAVGDAAFQKKCLGKMDDIASEGRTILFVSHNMAAVANLCQWAYLLDSGEIVGSGPAQDVIAQYVNKTLAIKADSGSYQVNTELLLTHQKKSNSTVIIENIELLDIKRCTLATLSTGDPFITRIYFSAEEEVIAPAFMVSIRDRYGVELTRISTMPISGYFIEEIAGKGFIDLEIHELPFTGGQYSISVGVARARIEWLVTLNNLVMLEISAKDVYHSGLALDQRRGLVALSHSWNLSGIEEM